MTFLRILRRQKDVEYVKSTATTRACWLCGKQLGHSFTSVHKDGRSLYVHFECRPEAAATVSGAQIVDDLPIG